MKRGKKVAIVGCSNGQPLSQKEKIVQLEQILVKLGLYPIFSDCIYEKNSVFSGSGEERAKCLMDFYKNDEIHTIFDISGGDLANEILPYLDFDVIKRSQATFWGYSDLTTIINAIYTKTGKISVLYQIRNFLSEIQDDLFEFPYEFIQGNQMCGVVVGGNIRCLLKLAGTIYWPDMRDKILVLESRGGTVAQIATYFSQLEQLGVFKQVHGILLGTFTQMEKEKCTPTVIELLKKYVSPSLPIAKTSKIGHGSDSKAIIIGKERVF